MKALLSWLRRFFARKQLKSVASEYSERDLKLLSRVILRDDPHRYDISRLKR